MTRFWERGALFVKELQELYAEPKPHFNTLSTMVRGLEAKGFLSHRAYGRGVISKYFHDSYLNAVSTLVREEKISVEELRELIERIEKGKE